MTHDPAASDANREVKARLEAYAAARLSPAADASTRMRTAVMREAHRASGQGLAVVDGGHDAVRDVASRGPRRARPTRLVAAVAAATLALFVLAGAALAARPGAPLYPIRLWVEAALMPAGDDARTEAEIGRLDDRLDEARSAAASGDHAGVVAALDAYRAILDEALGSANDAAQQGRLEAVLGTHLAVLEALTSSVPEPARDALARALERSGQAIDRVGGGNDTPPADRPGAGDGPDRPGRSAGTGQGNGEGRPTPAVATPDPPGGQDRTPGRPNDPAGRPSPGG